MSERETNTTLVIQVVFMIVAAMSAISFVFFFYNLYLLDFTGGAGAREFVNIIFSLFLLAFTFLFIKWTVRNPWWWKSNYQDVKKDAVRRMVRHTSYVVQGFYSTLVLLCIFTLTFGMIMANYGDDTFHLRGIIQMALAMIAIFVVFPTYSRDMRHITHDLVPAISPPRSSVRRPASPHRPGQGRAASAGRASPRQVRTDEAETPDDADK